MIHWRDSGYSSEGPAWHKPAFRSSSHMHTSIIDRGRLLPAAVRRKEGKRVGEVIFRTHVLPELHSLGEFTSTPDAHMFLGGVSLLPLLEECARDVRNDPCSCISRPHHWLSLSDPLYLFCLKATRTLIHWRIAFEYFTNKIRHQHTWRPSGKMCRLARQPQTSGQLWYIHRSDCPVPGRRGTRSEPFPGKRPRQCIKRS